MLREYTQDSEKSHRIVSAKPNTNGGHDLLFFTYSRDDALRVCALCKSYIEDLYKPKPPTSSKLTTTVEFFSGHTLREVL